MVKIFLNSIFIVSLTLSSLFYGQLSYAETHLVWVDVRSVLEHKLDHIEGDLRVTYTEVVDELSQRYPDKSTPIRLYCRSGGRAGKALQALQSAGYEDVANVGGINDARDKRGLPSD